MSVTVRMPQLGETVMEGTILRWAKEPGDAISEEEVLLEVSTDKVDTEVPSPAAGVVLEILVPAGETVPVGTALAVIGEAGELPAAAAPPAAAAVPPPPAAVAPPSPALPAAPPEEAFRPASTESAPPPVGRDGERTPADLGFLSPVVRRLASEHDLDLREVAGTGREGRVTRKDVQAFIDARAQAAPEAPVSEAPAPAVVMPEAVAAAPPVPVVEILPAVPVGIAPVEPVPTPPPPPAPAPVPEAAAEPAPVAAPPKRVGLGRGIGALIPTGAIPTAAGPETAPEAAPEAAPAAAAPAEPAPKPPTTVPLRPSDRAEDPSRLRMRIAEHMVTNRRTAAHVWTVVEVDFEAVEQVRRRLQEVFRSREGFSLTYLPFIARATVDALNAFPVVNSSFYAEEKKQVFHGAINLGIAVDLDQRGLIVMNIPGADGIRMRELARRIRAVADKARRGDLTPDDAAGSTFTITNPGPYGSFMSAPIINVPEVAILSTDTVTKRPVVVTDSIGNDAIAVRHIGYLGLSWDHRAFDGSTAVLFLRRIKEILETRDWEQELA
jgi:pyruvate dehydrogenase E2 component (dihydrolipoamide acetyltransferase)